MSFFQSVGSLFLNRQRRFSSGSISKRNVSPVTVDQARRCATVASAVDNCARAVAQLTFVAENRGPSGPVNQVLRRPNDYQVPYTFWHGIVEDLLYEGNAIVRVIRGLSGAPMLMTPLTPSGIELQVSEVGTPEYRSLEVPGQVFSSADIVHVKDGGGSRPWAMSRIEKAGSRIMALIYADRLIQDTFENGLAMQYWVNNTGPRMSKEDREDLIKGMQTQFGVQGERRGGVAVMENMEIHTISGLKPADADLRALRQDLIREIAAEFSVPPFRVGGTGDTKYSNYTAAMLTFYRDTVVPTVTNLQQSFSTALGATIYVDTSDILSGDLKTQVDIALRGAGVPVLTPNEARQLAGFKPMDDPQMDEVQLQATAAVTDDDRSGETPSDDGATDAGGMLDEVA